MTTETNEIISAADLAFANYDGNPMLDDGPAEAPDMNATRDPEPGISFHVQMQGYTKAAMDDLIVEAAAQLIVGRHNKNEIAKVIEARCIDLIAARADKALAAVTADIIDQPLTPSFGDKKPVTMREFIGLTGREYLDARVGNDGKPVSSDGWGHTHSKSRIEYLVGQHMQRAFKNEIEKATNGTIRELQAAIKTEHQALLDQEKARLREALGKAVS